ncbi:unnamed protein product, partial [Prorocentrum cordatum]
MVVRLDTAAASMTDPTERAELHGRELRSDMAAFKAANHGAILEDFVAWRTDAERLSLDAFPLDWLRAVFLEVEPRPAGEQQDAVLFRPEQDPQPADLENIDGTQLLLQLLRALLRVTLEDLSHCASPGGPEALRALHDRAVEAALAAFCPATRSGDAHSPFGGDGEEDHLADRGGRHVRPERPGGGGVPERGPGARGQGVAGRLAAGEAAGPSWRAAAPG